MRKIGTVIAFQDNEGKIYLTQENTLSRDYKEAKIFRASKAVLGRIENEAKTKFPNFRNTAMQIERWTDDVI